MFLSGVVQCLDKKLDKNRIGNKMTVPTASVKLCLFMVLDIG